jgi:transcription antitermination factor NusG
MVEVPIFSGYLFVCTDLLNQSKLQVLKVPGVVDFIRNHLGPLPIPNSQIEDIRTVLRAGVQCSSHSFIGEGARTRVVRGVLAGTDGQAPANALSISSGASASEPTMPISPAGGNL